ncbi:hypothetical protein [Streptomyces sp. NBC_01197]|uniref:hypothetical protein n=1 Tax=Streptomyces sp. NBC_01197 TaxID=2903768 RepID=UPI002E14B046|nr:hypothetical protein OG452_35125 [Streptomyces sp. NBC_01197]
MAIVAVVGIIVVGGGNSMQPKGPDGKSQPRPASGVYPVKFSGWGQKPIPRPTVSYPIRFPSP